MRSFLTICLILMSLKFIGAQEYNLIFDRFQYNLLDESLNKKGSSMHTAVKPFRMSEILQIANPDTITGARLPDKKFYRSLVGRKIFTENLFKLEKEDVQVYLDPLFSFEAGQDRYLSRNTWTNSRGIQVQGTIGKKVSFYSSFWENQAIMVNYVDSFVKKNNVVPGQGRVKPFGDSGYDYAFASGYISYTPTKHFNFQLGNDKNFIGDGYRSLLLSDNALNYPYFKISTNFWKIKYTNLFMAWQNIGNASNSGVGGYLQKFSTMHHLSYNATPWLNVGLFESIIWQGGDTTGARRGFDPNYLNPIIFYRPVEFSRGSPDNVLIGFNLKALILKKYQLYGQVVIDEFSLKEVKAGNGWWANKQGLQLGWKFYRFLGIKNLTWQNELNVVRPYTYGHFTSEQSYTHYAQPMAHPLGANFIENVQFLRWQYKRFGVEAKFILAKYGADSLKTNGNFSNYGQNIFQGTAEIVGGPTEVPSIYGNKMLQGVEQTVMYTDLNLSYLINPRTGMRIELSLSRRKQENFAGSQNTTWAFFTFRTNLPNRYYDF